MAMSGELTKFLFGSMTVLFPIIIGVIIFSWVVWCIMNRRQEKDSSIRRKSQFESIRGFIPLLTLSGLLGTVWSMADTLYYLSKHTNELQQTLPEVISRFAPALASTFWGISFAIGLLGLIQAAIYDLELNEHE